MNSTKLRCCQWIPIPEISSVAPEMPVMRDVRFPSYKWMVFVDCWATSIHLWHHFLSADSWIVVLKMNLHQIFLGRKYIKIRSCSDSWPQQSVCAKKLCPWWRPCPPLSMDPTVLPPLSRPRPSSERETSRSFSVRKCWENSLHDHH